MKFKVYKPFIYALIVSIITFVAILQSLLLSYSIVNLLIAGFLASLLFIVVYIGVYLQGDRNEPCTMGLFHC